MRKSANFLKYRKANKLVSFETRVLKALNEKKNLNIHYRILTSQ